MRLCVWLCGLVCRRHAPKKPKDVCEKWPRTRVLCDAFCLNPKMFVNARGEATSQGAHDLELLQARLNVCSSVDSMQMHTMSDNGPTFDPCSVTTFPSHHS